MTILICEDFDVSKYNEFILECSTKDYNGRGCQLHHIIPIHMGGTNQKDNLIKLGYKDHYEAHLILSNCFPCGHEYKTKNIAAANLILRSAKRFITNNEIFNDVIVGSHEFWEIASIEIPKLLFGENNPFYGKTHSDDVKKIIKEKRLLQVITPESNEKRSKTLKNKYSSGEIVAIIPVLTPEQEIRRRIKIREFNKNRFQLPDGVDSCDIIVNGIHKLFCRKCPICNEVIYHSKKYVAIAGHKKKRKCKKCVGNECSNTKSCANSYVKILHVPTNIVYDTILSATKFFNCTFLTIKHKIDIGEFIILDSQNAKTIQKNQHDKTS